MGRMENGQWTMDNLKRLITKKREKEIHKERLLL